MSLRQFFTAFLLLSLVVVTVTSSKILKTSNNKDNIAAVSGAGSGLVLNYSFDEGSGTNTSDLSGGSNNGTLVSNPTWTTGKAGQAISVANGSYVRSSGPVSLSNNFSASAWINVAELPPGGSSAGVVENAYNTGFKLGVYNNGVSLTPFLQVGGNPLFVDTSISRNQWVHIAMTFNGSFGVLYLNGVEQSATGASINNQNLPIFIGTYSHSPGEIWNFNGLIDDVRVYSRTLSGAEIMEIYNSSGVSGGGSSGGGGNSGQNNNNNNQTDISPPSISNVTASSISTSGVTISWSTDESADSQVEYGITSSYGSVTSINSTPKTAHSISLSSLSPSTTYNFRVKSKDASGNLATSNNNTFTTSAVQNQNQNQSTSTNPTGSAPDAPSVITAVPISGRQINVAWSPSLGTVRATRYNVYKNGSLIGSTGTLENDHVWKDPGLFQDLGLVPNTSYSYYVKAVSSGGVESPATRTVTARTKASSEVSLIPSDRVIDWTPGINVGVPGGIPTNRTTIIDISKAPYFAAGSIQTTTGSAEQGSKILTVSSPADFKAGHSITIKNAGRNRYVYDLIVDFATTIESVNGNTITLSDPVQASVTNVLIEHDDGAVIGRAIKDAPNNSVVYIPPGVYKGGIGISRDNITVRGAGMDVTTIDCAGGCASIGRTDGYYNRNSFAITEGAVRGSNRITVADDSEVGVGSIIEISADNDISLPELSVTGYPNIRKQSVIVTAKSGKTLTINPPLNAPSYKNPIFITAAGYVSWSGIEDLTLDATKSHPTFAASMGPAYATWIKNVKIKGAGNYSLQTGCLLCEVRHSYLDRQDTQNSTNHAGLLGGGSGLLFEDNIVDASFPLIELTGGANGNVFAYNFLNNGTLNTNHGPHNSLNLFEGNLINGGSMSDGYFGSESEGTFFRNWMTSAVVLKRWSRNFNVIGNQIGGYSFGQPNIGNADSNGFAAASAGVYWQDLNLQTGPTIRGTITKRHDDHKVEVTVTAGAQRLFSYCANLGGYCLSLGLQWGPWKGWAQAFVGESARSGNTMTLTDPYRVLPPEGTEVGILPRSEGFQELDLDVISTALLRANVYSGISGYMRGVNESLQSGETLPNSLYLNGKPAWFGSMQWPPFGPTSPNYNPEAIPAAYRYNNPGSEAPGVTNTNGNPVATSFTLSILKSGNGSGTVSGGSINCGNTCSRSAIPSGTAITLTATPAAGFNFNGWSGGGCSGTGSCTVNILTNTSVIAIFSSDSGTSSSPQNPTTPQTPDEPRTPSNPPPPVTPNTNSSGGGGGGGGGGGAPATVAPTISNVSISSYSSTSVTITWNTNLAATSQVEYGVTSAYGNSTPQGIVPTTSHRVTIASLAPKTTYHFRVKSNTSGMTATGADAYFTTGGVDTPVKLANTTVVTSSPSPVKVPVNTGMNTTVNLSTLSRPLTVGSSGEDVRTLQKYLNTQGYTIQATGNGSPGNESTYFGILTQIALAKFQAAKGITPANGYMGPKTIAFIQGQQTSPVTTTTSSQVTPVKNVTPTPTTPPSGEVYTRNLYVGVTNGEDVRALQRFLNKNGYVIQAAGNGSPGNESTYFGILTQIALAKFQTAKGITPANGYFGPKTRAFVEGSR